MSDIAPSVIWNCPNITELHIGNGLDGLPVIYDYEYASKGHESEYSTLWGYYYYYPSYGIYNAKIIEEAHLTGLKKIYIEDSSEKFSMKGFYNHSDNSTPAFANLDIDYYYVGRPLANIRYWNIGGSGFDVKYQQGYGHIDTLEIAGGCTNVPYFYQKIDNLILGNSVTYFDTQNVYIEGLKSIICKSTQPAQASGDLPGKVYLYTPLYIPEGSKEAYLNADVWKYFWNIIEVDMSDETGIISLDNPTKIDVSVDGRNIKISNNGKSSKIEVYNAAGTLVYNGTDNIISVNCAGLYIVRVGGQTKKLIVR
ncbi:MAG: T9SS type A sorting domain-containing protein [Prevotella sp.]|nr:T9SS type A sorting domain-containing protein [Prevotella sp.]MBO5156153.1 T9SS type A sorting domain-containing protein [Prevotella sp.]